jgi:hypothetical protein
MIITNQSFRQCLRNTSISSWRWPAAWHDFAGAILALAQ